MALGLIVIGRKVVKELGQNLTNLTPSTAFSSALATSLIMFFGTRAGLPLSGTHVLVLSFVGVSYAAREKIKMETLKGIAISWGLTVPACAVLSGVCALAYFAIV
jgi:phosphate/sulfate permease